MNCFFDFMDLYVCHFYWRFFFLYVNILGLIRKYKWNNDFLLKMKENKIKLLQSFLFFQLERGKPLHCGHGHVPAKAFRHRVGNNLLILRELILSVQGKFPVLSLVCYLYSIKPTYSTPDLAILGYPLLFYQASIVHIFLSCFPFR